MTRTATLALLAVLALPALAQDSGQPTGKRDLLIVADCSGSMMGQTTEGEVKLEAAKRVLAGLIEKLPADLNVGLMAYGHRVLAMDPGTCSDIEVLVPVVATDKALLAAKVKALQGKGRTPIAASLTKAGEVLKALGTEREKSLVFVTDGLETCGGDPKAAAAALQAMGIKLDFVVIGFDLAEAEAKAIAAIAEAGKGKYLDAKNSKELEGAFEKVNKAVVVKAPEVGRDEIVGKGGPAEIAIVGVKEGEVPVAAVLIARRADEVKEVARGDKPGFTFADFHGRGARILEVEPDTAAAKAGLERGDLVVRADDAAVASAKELADFLAARPGAEDQGRPWRLRVARFPMACDVIAPLLDNPKQEVMSGEYYVFLSGTRGSNNFGTDGIEANALKADGSWLSPLQWGIPVEPKQTVEVALNVGFRFIASETKHEMEDEVRLVNEATGVEAVRFSAAALGRYDWEEPAVIHVPAGMYTIEWRRREGKSWFGVAKGYKFDGHKLVDVKF
ncbi:MAG: VWA domain-containing protein [Planctomycetia bacterium]|nr:VWA domain-containing protein [Planctomycetia bacterium]